MDKLKVLDRPKEDSKKILIVEDNHLIMRWWERRLGKEGYKVFTAGNGKEGYFVAIREMPDLIVSDIDMPVMDGVEMASKLKASFHTRRIPVIFLTGLISEGDDGRQFSVDNVCLSKLSKPEEIITMIRNSLAG